MPDSRKKYLRMFDNPGQMCRGQGYGISPLKVQPLDQGRILRAKTVRIVFYAMQNLVQRQRPIRYFCEYPAKSAFVMWASVHDLDDKTVSFSRWTVEYLLLFHGSFLLLKGNAITSGWFVRRCFRLLLFHYPASLPSSVNTVVFSTSSCSASSARLTYCLRNRFSRSCVNSLLPKGLVTETPARMRELPTTLAAEGTGVI